MSKKELVKALMEQMQRFGYFPSFTNVKVFIQEYEKIAESGPTRPVVPEYIAEWIDACKENLAIGLYTALNPDFMKQYNKSDELIAWVRKHKNQEVFARAWLDGYEVEEEKLVKVRLKGTGQYLCNDETGLYFQHGFKTDFTKEYLEQANFGWVFDCEGVEVEEVEG